MLTTSVIVVSLAALVATPLGTSLGGSRLKGDAQAVSSSVSLAKMRAASLFTKTRLFVSIGGKSFHVDTWRKSPTPGWLTEGGVMSLAAANAFSVGTTTTAPPNSQTTIGQAPPCVDDLGVTVSGTACVVFNSRGFPVDAAGAPTGVNAFYLSDGVAVYAITVSATGMLRLWRSPVGATPTWAQQ